MINHDSCGKPNNKQSPSPFLWVQTIPPNGRSMAGFSQPQVRSVPPTSRPTLSSTSRWPWSLWLGEDGDEFV